MKSGVQHNDEPQLLPHRHRKTQVGQFGGIADEIDGLKRDKNVLMVELVRLRQQQAQADHTVRQLQVLRQFLTELGNRVHVRIGICVMVCIRQSHIQAASGVASNASGHCSRIYAGVVPCCACVCLPN